MLFGLRKADLFPLHDECNTSPKQNCRNWPCFTFFDFLRACWLLQFYCFSAAWRQVTGMARVAPSKRHDIIIDFHFLTFPGPPNTSTALCFEAAGSGTVGVVPRGSSMGRTFGDWEEDEGAEAARKICCSAGLLDPYTSSCWIEASELHRCRGQEFQITRFLPERS